MSALVDDLSRRLRELEEREAARLQPFRERNERKKADALANQKRVYDAVRFLWSDPSFDRRKTILKTAKRTKLCRKTVSKHLRTLIARGDLKNTGSTCGASSPACEHSITDKLLEQRR